METASALARTGNRILGYITAVFVLVVIAYSGYTLWDTFMVYQRAFPTGELMKFKPTGADPASNPTLEELIAINPDVLGWLTIDGTHIDYPVVQGQDDMEYLNKDVYGEFALSGSIFLTSDNASELTDRYNMVYGHHMDNGGMFGDVMEFLKEPYFRAHTAGKLYLPHATYEIQVFAILETDAYNGKIYSISRNKTSQELEEILRYVKENALWEREEVNVTGQDQVIALSTCVEAETNGRAVLFGKLRKL